MFVITHLRLVCSEYISPCNTSCGLNKAYYYTFISARVALSAGVAAREKYKRPRHRRLAAAAAAAAATAESKDACDDRGGGGGGGGGSGRASRGGRAAGALVATIHGISQIFVGKNM